MKLSALTLVFIFQLGQLPVASAQTAPATGGAVPPSPPAATPAPPAPAPEVTPPLEEGEVAPTRDLGILQGIIEDYDYRGADKRDPFVVFPGLRVRKQGPRLGPVTQLERFDLDQFRLIAIMWNVSRPKALLLDPENNNYVVFKKTRIGRRNGYVADIREGELVVMETLEREGQMTFQPRVIRLQRE